MKHTGRIFCAVMALLIFSQPIFADIGDFVDVIEEVIEIPEKKPTYTPPKKSSRSSRSYYSSAASDYLTLQLIELGFSIWFLNNFAAEFEPYPYAIDDRYINLDTSYSSETRVCRFSAGTQVGYQFGLGMITEQQFEGFFFKFFGPHACNCTYIDSNGILTGYTELGGQLALIQLNPFSMYFFWDWVHWYGKAGGILGTDGSSIGLLMRSYLVKPFALDFKVWWQEFDVNAQIFSTQVELGFFTGRHEHYLGWRYMSVGNSSGITLKEYNGITLGQRVYF